MTRPRIVNDALELLYYKKGLLVEEPDPRDYSDEVHLGSVGDKGKLPKYVNLGGRADNQGRTNKCTAYATKKNFEIHVSNYLMSKSNWFEAGEQWNNQLLDPGTADPSHGDYISSAMKSLKKFGLYYRGKQWMIDSYLFTPKESWKGRLAQGYPITTGLRVLFPMCDKDHVWRANTSGGGHAILIVGYDDKNKRFICLNSWGSKWGHNGYFYINYSDQALLMRGWVLKPKFD